MRIVSLCPSITESLVALGLGDALVGVTRYCVHPREALAGVPRVGGTKDPDVDAIRAMAPDLVFLNSEENRREDFDVLAQELRVDVSHPRNAGDGAAFLRHLGALTGREAEGEAWAARIEARLAAIRAVTWTPFRFAYPVWKDPWMLAGAGTYVDGLLREFGGSNVAPAVPGPDGAVLQYPSVTEEELVEATPDRLFLPDEPYRFGEADRARWRELLPRTRVALVSGDDLCWHGVRTLRGLDFLETLLGVDLGLRPSGASGRGTPP